MKIITPIQSAVLGFIKAHIDTKRCAPTHAEINANFGWTSSNAAKTHVIALRKKKQIRVAFRAPRGITIREA